MKNLLFITVMVITGALAVNAQTEAGKVLIGTSTRLYGVTPLTILSGFGQNGAGLTIMSSKSKSDNFEADAENQTIFNLSPRVGFFAADRLLIGLEVGFGLVSTKLFDDPITITSIEEGPFARYYLSSANFKPFVQAGASVGQIKVSTADSKTNIFTYGAGIGGAFFLNDKVAVDLLVNYLHTTAKEKDAFENARDITSSFGFGVGLSIFL